MGCEPDPETFLPDDLDALLRAAPNDAKPELMRRVLRLGVERVEVAEERFQAVWAAVSAQAHPTVAQARGLRALAREQAEARAAAPEDVGLWERAELTEGLVGALDVDASAAAYEATYSVHRAIGDHDAVLAVVRAAVTRAPPTRDPACKDSDDARARTPPTASPDPD